MQMTSPSGASVDVHLLERNADGESIAVSVRVTGSITYSSQVHLLHHPDPSVVDTWVDHVISLALTEYDSAVLAISSTLDQITVVAGLVEREGIKCPLNEYTEQKYAELLTQQSVTGSIEATTVNARQALLQRINNV